MPSLLDDPYGDPGQSSRGGLLGLDMPRIQQPDPDTDQGTALGQTYQAIVAEMARQQQISADRGLWRGGSLLEGGLPTSAGAVDAARQTANAVMMGTTAPESPAERFVDAFDAAHAESGLDAVSHMHFFEHGPSEVEISHIGVDSSQRGRGIGNTLMGKATDLADKHGVTLHASPASDADASTGLDYQGLRDWYQRWGFDEPGGGDRLTRRPYTDE